MAALNYSINLTDTSGSGLGPYTISILKNPTAATGGTDISARAGGIISGGSVVNLATNPTGVINPQELMGYAAHVVGDDIANTNQSDPLN